MKKSLAGAVLGSALALAAFGGRGEETATTPEATVKDSTVDAAPASAELPAPTIVSVNDITEGQVFPLEVGESLVLTDATGVTAKVLDPAVAEFTPAHADGGTEFNAGVGGVAPGTTDITLSTGVTFSVQVA